MVDLIDREALLKDKYLTRWDGYAVRERDILSAPTVDAVPVVHGKWEFIDKYNVRCSVCLRPRNGKTQILWEYCPRKKPKR